MKSWIQATGSFATDELRDVDWPRGPVCIREGAGMAGVEETDEGAVPAPAQGAARRGAAAFQFSTDDFRSHERIAAWRDVFGRTVLNIDVTPLNRHSFQASAAISRTGTFGVLRATTSPAVQSNSESLITNGDVSFGAVLSSVWGAEQVGRSSDLGPGDAVLMSNGDVGSLTFPQDCHYVAFSLPRAAFARLVPDVDALFARRIPADNPALQMLLRYLELGQDDLVAADPDLQAAFADHVCDLLALALGATRDAAEVARSRGLPAARLQAMKDDIRRASHNPDLTVHAVAARYGVSPRYVQRVFEESGSTFTGYLAEQRLLAAYKALRSHASSAFPISTIALNCGFSDVSHFNRLFRRRFGCTPGDVRKTARSHG